MTVADNRKLYSPDAREGAPVFGDGEQVDLHASSLRSLEDLTRTALEQAVPRHPLDTNDTDARRNEAVGGSVVKLAANPEKDSVDRELSASEYASGIGARILAMREQHLGEAA